MADLNANATEVAEEEVEVPKISVRAESPEPYILARAHLGMPRVRVR